MKIRERLDELERRRGARQGSSMPPVTVVIDDNEGRPGTQLIVDGPVRILAPSAIGGEDGNGHDLNS